LTATPLRVFVVPSWYPHPRAPMLGIFSFEEVMATAELHPDWRVAVAVWGQGEYDFALDRPREWPWRLRRYVRARTGRQELQPNLVEHRRRAATWARQLGGGNLRGVVRAVRSAFEAAAEELGGVDLVHAHVGFPGGFAAMRLREWSGVPYVVTEHWHSYPPPEFVLRDGRVDDRVLAPLVEADAVIAVSRAQALEIMAHGVQSPHVVPPSVDERRFAPGPGPPTEQIVLATICNMEERKGIDDLLEALRAVVRELSSQERDRLELRLGGGGHRLAEYRRLADTLGVSRWTRWLGPLSRDAVRREMQRCHCFVLPSRRESFGVVYVEAMACGRPVIAARGGGPEEIVTEETGILVNPGDVEGLAKALRRVIRSRCEWDSAVIRNQFLGRFSRPPVIERLERVYRGALYRGAL
jgi:glycosyltransferase involved in cell wall biosynthesis